MTFHPLVPPPSPGPRPRPPAPSPPTPCPHRRRRYASVLSQVGQPKCSRDTATSDPQTLAPPAANRPSHETLSARIPSRPASRSDLDSHAPLANSFEKYIIPAIAYPRPNKKHIAQTPYRGIAKVETAPAFAEADRYMPFVSYVVPLQTIKTHQQLLSGVES